MMGPHAHHEVVDRSDQILREEPIAASNRTFPLARVGDRF